MASIEVWEYSRYASEIVRLLGFLIVYQERINTPYYLLPDKESDFLELTDLVSRHTEPNTIYRVTNNTLPKFKIQTPTIKPLQIIDQSFDIQIVDTNSLIVDQLKNSIVFGHRATDIQNRR